MRLFEVYNIPRNKMPQINKKHLDAYPKTLQVVDIASVTPSQSDRVPGMVDKTLAAFKAGEKELLDKPMVVDRDLNIVNGHHRYDALKKMGMTKVPVLKVDATLPELIDDFSHTTSDRPVKEVKYTEPQLDVEWEEANRYDYLAKLGQAGWVELAKQGKAITVDSDSVKKIGNTGADGSETLDDLEPDKVDRLNKAMKSGTVEMPIVIKQPDGSLELVAGNTRLIGLINKLGKAVVWYVDASNTVSDKPVGEAKTVKLSDKEIGDVKLGTGENLWLATYNDGSTKKVVARSHLGVRKQLKEPDGKYKKPAEPSNYELGIRRIEKVSMPDRRPDTKWTNRPVKKQKAPRRVPRKSHDQDKFGPAAFDAEKAALRKKIDDLEFEREQRRLMGEGNKAQKGIPANATDAELKSARKAGGDKGKRAHWLLNMRKGNQNRKKS